MLVLSWYNLNFSIRRNEPKAFASKIRLLFKTCAIARQYLGSVKLQYRYLIYPKHVFLQLLQYDIYYICLSTNICTLKKYLSIFSYIFHPVFIPVFATLFYIFAKSTSIGFQEKIFILLQVFIVTLVVPILFFFLLKATGKISSLMVPSISERKLPLVIHSFLIIILVKQSITLERYSELHFFMLGALMSTLIALILLFFKSKASLHMIGITGLTIFYFGLSILYQTQNFVLFAILIFIIGAVASSRLEMKAHNTKEVLIGMLIGGGPQLLLMPLWL